MVSIGDALLWEHEGIGGAGLRVAVVPEQGVHFLGQVEAPVRAFWGVEPAAHDCDQTGKPFRGRCAVLGGRNMPVSNKLSNGILIMKETNGDDKHSYRIKTSAGN